MVSNPQRPRGDTGSRTRATPSGLCGTRQGPPSGGLLRAGAVLWNGSLSAQLSGFSEVPGSRMGVGTH